MLEAGRESKIVKFQIYLKIVVGRRKSVARRCRVKSLRVSERAEESPFEPSKFFDSTPFSNLQVFRLQCLCWWEIDQSPFVNFIPRFEILLLHIDDSSTECADEAYNRCRTRAVSVPFKHRLARYVAVQSPIDPAAGCRAEMRALLHSFLASPPGHKHYLPQPCGILSTTMRHSFRNYAIHCICVGEERDRAAHSEQPEPPTWTK